MQNITPIPNNTPVSVQLAGKSGALLGTVVGWDSMASDGPIVAVKFKNTNGRICVRKFHHTRVTKITQVVGTSAAPGALADAFLIGDS